MKATAADQPDPRRLKVTADPVAFMAGMARAEQALRAQRPIDPPEDDSSN